MRNTSDSQDQSENSTEMSEHTAAEQTLAIGLPQATELATAGATAVVPAAKSRQRGDRLFGGVVRTAVWVFFAIFVGIALVLILQSIPSMQRSGLSFYTSSAWDPVNDVYGIAPIIVGTLVVAAVALVIATTVGLASAIFIVDYAPRWLREPVGFLIELLAYIPSVVYGLWALLVMAPWLQSTIQPWIQQTFGQTIAFLNGPPYGVGIMAAILILSIMLLPLIVSLSREALLLVPDSQREAMLALGATRWEVLRQAVIPYARGGIFGAITLSLGRAVGETMAVAMVIGGAHQLPQTLFDQGYTLASVIANEFNEASSAIYLSSLIHAGLILFLITAVINVAAYFLMKRMVKIGHA